MNSKILIVDDEPNNLDVLRDCLSKAGFKVPVIESGETALELVDTIKPDLILLDIMMPGMDGFEVCRRLKQDATSADIPIIFLTAKLEKDDVITGLKLGAVDYVTKPFNQEELLTRVNTHLVLQAAKENLREALAEKEEALAEKEVALAEKEEALATKDKLFSIIGHDLGNIFYGLQGFTELLIEETNVKTREKYLQTLKRAASDGYDLLNNLLNWSKSQTGKLQPYLTTLILQELIRRNIELQHNKANHKKIDVVTVIDENITVYADENMLNAILRNLLSNAIKFTLKSGTIRITTKAIDDNVVEISIADTGVGIEDISKIFQVSIARNCGTDGEQGGGLGLVLCKELIKKCNGTIGVESKVGEGSRFYVRLPIK